MRSQPGRVSGSSLSLHCVEMRLFVAAPPGVSLSSCFTPAHIRSDDDRNAQGKEQQRALRVQQTPRHRPEYHLHFLLHVTAFLPLFLFVQQFEQSRWLDASHEKAPRDTE